MSEIFFHYRGEIWRLKLPSKWGYLNRVTWIFWISRTWITNTWTTVEMSVYLFFFNNWIKIARPDSHCSLSSCILQAVHPIKWLITAEDDHQFEISTSACERIWRRCVVEDVIFTFIQSDVVFTSHGKQMLHNCHSPNIRALLEAGPCVSVYGSAGVKTHAGSCTSHWWRLTESLRSGMWGARNSIFSHIHHTHTQTSSDWESHRLKLSVQSELCVTACVRYGWICVPAHLSW